ncbi:MAG TPA: ABC transporter ATP-binding protein [Trebonia sp.]|nr:ABC transporter ATP-binding protein [Trebonia sp.]
MSGQQAGPAQSAQPASALSVRALSISRGATALVSDVSFDLAAGERLAIIGESGSGKTLTALAAMGLLPAGLTASGKVEVHGADLFALSERARSRLRGSALAMVFQEPMTALNPTMRVGRQVAEAIRAHRPASRAQARAAALELLRRVELTDPERQARSFPHQLSGGQRQRVVLAMAIACDPAVILADEPTTALDVTVQEQVLGLLSRLVDERGSALVLISHDLAVVSGLCDAIMVLYGGRVAELGPVRDVLTAPRHPYTAALVATSAAVTLASDRGAALPVISGQVPAAGAFPAGCPFRNRCDRATAECEQVPSLAPAPSAGPVSPGSASAGSPADRRAGAHLVACFHPVASSPSAAATPATAAQAPAPAVGPGESS